MFSPELEWAEHQPLAAERIISGAPEGRMAIGSAPITATYGQWEGTPGHFTAVPSTQDEVVTILAGSGTLCAASGEEIALEPGRTFVIPAGFTGEWIIETTVRKAFVFVAPQS